MAETVLSNLTVVTPERVFAGSVRFEEGLITAVDEGSASVAGAEDCEGDLLIPGLVEIHTDNVERHMEPRPGVLWPSSISALLAHDVQMAGAGITTVLDAICVGDYHSDGRRRRLLDLSMEALTYGREADLFRCEHLVHMRCEVSDEAVVEMFEPFAGDPLVRLVSIMDHTPGQRQWRDLEKMRTFHSKRRSYTEEELAEYIRERQEVQARVAEEHRRAVLDLWRPRGLPIASHDDTTTEHVEESARDGIRISEFPTTVEAAEHAAAHDMLNVMGSPNLVRGGSHSGNVSAGELADRRLLHALSSDYVPVSLLHGALKLHDEHGYTLPEAIATVTINVAEVLGFSDRGAVEAGKRADLVRLRRLPDGSAAVRAVWRGGVRIS